MDISDTLCSIGDYLTDHLPTILSIAACGGVVGTGVLVYKEAGESHDILNEIKENNPEELKTVSGICKVTKPLLPAIGAGLATILCIGASDYISAERINDLTDSYNFLASNFTEYKQETGNVLGEGAAAAVVGAVAKKRIGNADIREGNLGERNGEQLHWFFDNYSQTWFISDWRTIKDAEIKLNTVLRDHGEALVENYYEFLGMDLPQVILTEALNSQVELLWSKSYLKLEHGRTDIPVTYSEVKEGDKMLGYAIDFPILPESSPYYY